MIHKRKVVVLLMPQQENHLLPSMSSPSPPRSLWLSFDSVSISTAKDCSMKQLLLDPNHQVYIRYLEICSFCSHSLLVFPGCRIHCLLRCVCPSCPSLTHCDAYTFLKILALSRPAGERLTRNTRFWVGAQLKQAGQAKITWASV